jgi:hypothetical protein
VSSDIDRLGIDPVRADTTGLAFDSDSADAAMRFIAQPD